MRLKNSNKDFNEDNRSSNFMIGHQYAALTPWKMSNQDLNYASNLGCGPKTPTSKLGRRPSVTVPGGAHRGDFL